MNKTAVKRILPFLLVACMLVTAFVLSACSTGGGSTQGDKKDGILPTATIKLVPEVNGLTEEGNLVCLSASNGDVERLDVVINLANPDKYEILSVEYYTEVVENGETVHTDFKVESENFGYDSDTSVVYLRNVSVGKRAGSVKLGFNTIRYKYKTERRAIAGISGTEFTVLIAPEFELTMDISECKPRKDGSTQIKVKNDFASGISVKSDYDMNLTNSDEAYGVDGFIFAGWYTEPNGAGTRYSNKDTYLFYSDITLYAHYERAVTYSVATSDDGEEYAVVTGLSLAGKASSFTIDIPEELDGYVVREIGYMAFSGVGAGRQFILPDTLYKIGDYAFNACTGLQIHLASVRQIGNFAFADCGKIILGKASSFAYERESGLPTSLTKIGNYAFRGTGWDASVINPYRDGGYYKSDLTLILPASLKTIGDGAFTSSLFKTVYFRTGIDVVSLGDSVFEGSTALENVYTSFDFKSTGAGHIDVSTGDGLEKISDRMFYNCTSLSSKVGSENVKLAEGLKTIGDLAFASSGKGMTKLEYIKFPDSLESLGTESFANTNLTKVEFGTGSKLKVLGKWCFENSKFTEITLYSLTQYKEAPFWGNTNLERINILTDNVPTYSTPDSVGLGRNSKYFVKASMLNGFRNSSSWNPTSGYFEEYSYKPSDYVFAYDYIVENDDLSFCYEPISSSGDYDADSKEVRIVCVFGTKKDIAVPQTFVIDAESYKVVSVGRYFVHEGVTKIKLPSTLKSIEKYAFYATALYDVKWTVDGSVKALDAVSADELSLETIGEWAFYATSISKFYSNTALRSIGKEAFKYCLNLSKIVLNKGTSLVVEGGAFSTCGGNVTSGTALAISRNVVAIGRSAFQDNANLRVVYMEPATVPEAPGGGYPAISPFTGCNALEAVYVFNKDALDSTIVGSFTSTAKLNGYANVYSGLKKADGITSAYVLADISWTDAVKKVA